MASRYPHVDGRTRTHLYDYSHGDPDCRHVHFIYFCFRVGAVHEFMETTSSQLGNSWFLHPGRSANHITDDAKDEENYVASNPSFVVCPVRVGDGAHTDQRQ